MVEIFGVVASGIAVVDMTSKVLKSFVALKDLWQRVQDVSNTIKYLMAEIKILVPFLQDRSFDGCQNAQTYALNAPNQLSRIMATLKVDIENASRKAPSLRNRISGVKVAMKQDVLSRHETRLHSAVRLLNLARHCYTISLQEKGQLRFDQFAETVDQFRKSLPPIDNRTTETRPNQPLDGDKDTVADLALPSKYLVKAKGERDVLLINGNQSHNVFSPYPSWAGKFT